MNDPMMDGDHPSDNDNPYDEIEVDMDAARHWVEQSILNFWDHQRAELIIWGIFCEQGVTQSEVYNRATTHTLERFERNPVGWDEAEIRRIVDIYIDKVIAASDKMQTEKEA
jgi:hypothetical protein